MTPGASGPTLADAKGRPMPGSEADGRAGDWELDLVVSCSLALACGLAFGAALFGLWA